MPPAEEQAKTLLPLSEDRIEYHLRNNEFDDRELRLVATIAALRAENERLKATLSNCVLNDPPGDCYASQVVELRAEINDWQQAAQKAALENCGDEKHCTCVGLLHHQLAGIKARIERALEHLDIPGIQCLGSVSLAIEKLKAALAKEEP